MLNKERDKHREQDNTEKNLMIALRALEEEILEMGYHEVKITPQAIGFDSVTTFIFPKPQNRSLNIISSGDYSGMHFVELCFESIQGSVRRVSIVCHEDENNHLSEPASPETFKARIKKALTEEEEESPDDSQEPPDDGYETD